MISVEDAYIRHIHSLAILVNFYRKFTTFPRFQKDERRNPLDLNLV